MLDFLRAGLHAALQIGSDRATLLGKQCATQQTPTPGTSAAEAADPGVFFVSVGRSSAEGLFPSTKERANSTSPASANATAIASA